MSIPTTLQRLVATAVITVGTALFASALHGVARMDASLELAASRSTPDQALIQERSHDCPDRAQGDEV